MPYIKKWEFSDTSWCRDLAHLLQPYPQAVG